VVVMAVLIHAIVVIVQHVLVEIIQFHWIGDLNNGQKMAHYISSYLFKVKW